MNWTYDSRFYGKDIFRMKPQDERAFIATYQRLGYLRPNSLTILEPVRRSRLFTFESFNGEMKSADKNSEAINDAIAEYQTASYLFSKGLNRASQAK
jgi:hypothetical protein